MRLISSGLLGLWLLGLAVSSDGMPSDVEPITQNTAAFSANIQDVKVDKLPSVVVPQIGVLEERPGGVGKEDTLPIIIANPNGSGTATVGNEETIGGNAAKGILVPIVSIIDPDTPKKTSQQWNNPLVALLPALPEAAAPPPLILDDNQRPIRRSALLTDDQETMDVAEDIVFRPLFRIRQPRIHNIERNYRPNYRRYNINGYYRLPYE